MSTSSRSKLDQTFNLQDGRALGFAEYGDPNGHPLLYFHGFPSSRLEASPVDDIARRLRLRIISLDRPGFGLSTPQPGRGFLDWAADVKDFTTGMGLSRFAVMGLSGGGPYAAACAYAFPRQTLTSVGLFATGPHWAAGGHHMTVARRITRWLANHWPSGLRFMLNSFVRFTAWVVSTGPITRRIDKWIESQDEKKEEKKKKEEEEEEEVVVVEGEEDATTATTATTPEKPSPKRTVAERREDLVHMLLGEPFAQGAAATVQEAKLLCEEDWGFKLEDIQYDPVRIWHGAEDRNAPAVMIRYMAERIPRCVYREFEGDTHYTMYKHAEGAFAEMAQDISEAEKEQQ